MVTLSSCREQNYLFKSKDNRNVKKGSENFSFFVTRFIIKFVNCMFVMAWLSIISGEGNE